MYRLIIILATLAVIIIVIGCTSGGELTITDIWARPASAGGNGAAYFVIDNPTGQADILLGARSDISEAVEMHLSSMDANGVMSMQPQNTVDVPAKSQVEFKPGSLHLMLIRLKEDLRIGKTFPVTLIFEQAGEVTIQVEVKE